MHILILADHYPVASGRYAADAFRRLGHTVDTIGLAHGNAIWGMHVADELIWTPTGMTAQPDLVIAMDSAPHILDFAAQGAVENPDTPVVVWGVDNHVRDYRRHGFKRYFLAHRAVSLMDWQYGRNEAWDAGCVWESDIQWLPCAYDPIAFTPSPIPYAERPFDFALVGVMYPQRLRIVNLLTAKGYTVAYGTGLLYHEFADVYHRARVSLCISAAHDAAQRVFETAALGCGLLCDTTPDLAALDGFGDIMQIGINAPDAQWLAAAAASLDAEYAAACCAAAKPHTWDARASEIIRWYQHER